jgi:hypothetical protein
MVVGTGYKELGQVLRVRPLIKPGKTENLTKSVLNTTYS